MVQIARPQFERIPSGYEQELLRQQNLDRGIRTAIGGMQGLERQKQFEQETARQRALREMDLRGKLASQGQAIDPQQSEQITQAFQEDNYGSLAPVFEQQAQQVNMQRQEDRDFKRSMMQQQQEMRNLQQQKLQRDLAPQGPKQLSAKDVMTVQEGNQIPVMLEDVSTVIRENIDLFDPIKGTLASYNPYDERVQSTDAQMRAASQAFGRFMEGGVLRKEDEEKYRRMFPKVGDTPGVAQNKLQTVQRLLSQRQRGSLDALGKAGYDVSAFEAPKEVELVNFADIGKGAVGEGLQQTGQELNRFQVQIPGLDQQIPYAPQRPSVDIVPSAIASEGQRLSQDQVNKLIQRRSELLKKAGM